MAAIQYLVYFLSFFAAKFYIQNWTFFEFPVLEKIYKKDFKNHQLLTFSHLIKSEVRNENSLTLYGNHFLNEVILEILKPNSFEFS